MTEASAHQLLNDLLGPDPARRVARLDVLGGAPETLAALRPYLYDRLADDPADRFRPALLIRDLYRDAGPLLRVVVEAMRSAAPDDDVRDEVLELPTLGVPKLLVECAFARPALFSVLFERSPRWVTRQLLSTGAPGILTLRLFVAELPNPYLHQVAALIADEAVSSPHDLGPLVQPLSAVRLRPLSRLEIGVALWRLTWRVDAEWVDWLLESRSWTLTELLADAILEMLPVCPRLEPLVLQMLDANRPFTRARTWVAPIVRRVLRHGWRGVKLLQSVDPHHHDSFLPFRAELLAVAAESETQSRAFLPVALRVIESPSLHIQGDDAPDALRAACRIVATVGPAAKEAVPNLFNLEESTDSFSLEISAALVACAGDDPATRDRLLERLLQLTMDVAGSSDDNARRRLDAIAATLIRLKTPWLPRVIAEPTVSRTLRRRLGAMLGTVPDEDRRRASDSIFPLLADARLDVRADAGSWLRILEPDAKRVWPWLVAAMTLSVDNRKLTGLFAWIEPEQRGAVEAEVEPLVDDPNPVVAANAEAALEVLQFAP